MLSTRRSFSAWLRTFRKNIPTWDRHLEKARSLKIEGNYHTNEKVIDNKTTLLMNSIKNHRDFIIHTKQNHFSKQFVMSIVFNLWKAQCNKTTEKINNGEAN